MQLPLVLTNGVNGFVFVGFSQNKNADFWLKSILFYYSVCWLKPMAINKALNKKGSTVK
jgi:hypothetical protein